jgi:uncharacterized RDD family membrane protein YckC
VIRICQSCGALILEDTDQCSFCNASFAEDRAVTRASRREEVVSPDSAQPAGEQFLGSYSTRENSVRDASHDFASHRASVGLAASPRESSEQDGEPEWRREVTRRLEDYRARRRRLNPDEPQSGLPFHEEVSLQDYGEEPFEIPMERPRPARPSHRKNQAERVEINVQPELDFSSSTDDRAHPQSPLVPVASVAARRWAGVIDFLFLGFTCAGFFGLFRSLGGEMLLDKVDALVYAAVAFLFYCLYFFLFTTFAGATPGMQLRALTIVRLDGTLPETRQLLWRSFGYALSGATLMLGFIWALWDEDHFTWQDRISHTYVTAATPVADAAPLAPSPHSGTLAHR